MEIGKLLDSVISHKSLRVIQDLGKGPYGNLYLVQDQLSGLKYGLKLISPEVSAKMPLGGLVESIRDANEITHPNVVSKYEFGFADGQAYIVREYVSGLPLENLVRQSQTKFDELLDIATQSARGVAAVHGQGLVHNNIKPNNLIVTPGHRIKLVDLGLAPNIVADITSNKEGGTLRSPTEVPTGESGTASADIYHLGSVLHRVAFGKNPPASRPKGSVAEAMVQNMRARSVSPAQGEDVFAARFGKILENLLDPEPTHRPSAVELLMELEDIRRPPGRSSKKTSSRRFSRPVDDVSSRREVNAWLVDGAPPLLVGDEYQLGVDIGDPRSGRIGGGKFTEPDWAELDHLDLVILVDGSSFNVSPSFQEVVLPRHGKTETKLFMITPRSSGPLTLNLSIFLARELTLMEEFIIEVMAEERFMVVASAEEQFDGLRELER